MTINSQEARQLLAIICQEVLDILDLPEDAPRVKCVEIRDLIDSWVSANSLNIGAVQKQEGVYLIGLSMEANLDEDFIDPDDEMEALEFPFPFKKFILIMGAITIFSLLITYIKFTWF